MLCIHCRALALAIWAGCSVFAPGICQAATPAPHPRPGLHERIDALVEGSTLLSPPELADDAEFMRRVYLDLTGVIPTANEARAFFADSSPSKRPELIERLLAGPRFARQMATFWDATLLDRAVGRKTATISSNEWQEYLYRSFAENKPLDQLAREILSADGAAGDLRPAVKFYLDLQAEPHEVTRAVGRVFFGMDLQCAQCHDHPLVDDYYQLDYYGLHAFVLRSTLFTDKKKQVSLAEKAEGEASFRSVFTGFAVDRLPPRLPKEAPAAEPVLAKGQEYVVAPAKGVRSVPKFSRRAQLAALTSASPAFRLNLANRLWALMLGRGLVQPLDYHHSDNPASNPELLALLADELLASKFDTRYLLREIALSRTYQRTSRLPARANLRTESITARLERLRAETKRFQATAQVTQVAFGRALEQANQARAASAPETKDAKPAEAKKPDGPPVAARQAARKPAAQAVTPQQLAALEQAERAAYARLVETKASAAMALRRQNEAEQLATYERLAKTDRAAAGRVWSSLVDDWTTRTLVGVLKPLTGEQLALSTMQATGILPHEQSVVETVLKKAPPAEMQQLTADERPRAMALMIERRTVDQLRGPLDSFADLYRAEPGDDFQATVNQALFFGNGPSIATWLGAGRDSLLERLQKMTDDKHLADELYLSVFTRHPTRQEIAEVATYLKNFPGKRPAALAEIAWGLLASNEFRFNH